MLELFGIFLIFGPLFISVVNSSPRDAGVILICFIVSVGIGIGVGWLTTLVFPAVAPITGLAAYWYSYYWQEPIFNEFMKNLF